MIYILWEVEDDKQNSSIGYNIVYDDAICRCYGL